MNKKNFALIWGLMLLTSAALAQEVFRLGQIVPLSGPLANVGKEISVATQVAIAQHNKSNRKKIELVLVDDANNPEKSEQAVASLSGKVSSLVSCFGTVSCMAQAKAAKPLGLPLIGPIAGAAQLRGKAAPLVYAVRASADEELARLIQLSQTMGLTRLAVVIQDDGFGQAYWAALQPLLKYSGVEVSTSVLIKPQSPGYDAAAGELLKTPVNAVLLLANATHSVGVLKAWRDKTPLPFVLNLSGQANGLFVNGLKGYSGAAAFVTTTRSPWEQKSTAQREYQAAMAEAGERNFSYLSFEAYMNACIAMDAIKNAKDATPNAMRYVLEKRSFAYGGSDIFFGEKANARFTDLAVLRADGTFRH